jgi:branched-chain amino acid transport system substrate-binding protein
MRPNQVFALSAAVAGALACQQILGIEERVYLAPCDAGQCVMSDNPVPDASNFDAGRNDGGMSLCTTNAECGPADASFVCVKSKGTCANLLSTDCLTVYGDAKADNAIILGSLAALTTQASLNGPRLNAANLAVSEINLYGGIPDGKNPPRPLALVSCDSAANLLRSARHLIEDLGAPAIVGPTLSQDAIDLTTKLSANSGTLLMSATTITSAISDLQDNNLTWRVIPNDVQRNPLFVQRINSLESEWRDGGVDKPKLSIIWRNDVLGSGAYNALSTMTFNGKPLTDPANKPLVSVEPYDPTLKEQTALVSRQLAFAPNIVAWIGTSESIALSFVPMENGWPGGKPKPAYVFIEPLKVRDLITAVNTSADPTLRTRISGIGAAPTPESESVLRNFESNFTARFPGVDPKTSGAAATHDVVYALATAIAAQKQLPITGANIALGLKKLATGGPTIAAQPTNLISIFGKAASGEPMTLLGTGGPFEWDANGDIVGSQIEIWCVGKAGGSASFGPSGAQYNTKTKTFSGTYAPCP